MSTLGSYKHLSNKNLEKLIKNGKLKSKFFRKLRSNIEKGNLGDLYEELIELMNLLYPENVKKELNLAKSLVIY